MFRTVLLVSALALSGCVTTDASFSKAGASDVQRKADYTACYDSGLKEWPYALDNNGIDRNHERRMSVVRACMAGKGYSS